MRVNYASNGIGFGFVLNYSTAKLWLVFLNIFNNFINYFGIIKDDKIKDIAAIDIRFCLVDSSFLYFRQSGMKILN